MFRSLARLLIAPTALCAVAFGISACEDSGLSVLNPKIETDPEAGSPLVFDQIVLGRERADDQFVRIFNVGTGSLEIREVRIDGAGSEAFQLLRVPTSVAANDQKELYIRFEPTAPLTIDATLVIVSNDRDRPEVSFPIQASSREPCILGADQSKLFFDVGDVREVTLSANSSYECVVERIFLDRDVFPLVDEPELPFTIPAGGTHTLQIEHRAVVATNPGAPVREMRVAEADGGEVSVFLEGEPPLYGCLSFFPNLLSFSSTVLGESRTQFVDVINGCNKPAAITSALINFGWEDFSLSTGPYPASIEAGGTMRVGVTYAPTIHERLLAEDQGRLIVNTNDASLPRIRVGLTAQPGLPRLEYFPQVLDFGTVIFRNPGGPAMRSECSSPARFVQLHNTGGGPLTISGLELVTTGDADFLIASVTVNGSPVPNFTQPFTIPAGQSANVGLVFFPTRTNPELHESVLLVSHNAGPDAAEIRLIGNAAPDGQVQDIFTQADGPMVDILWVIDDSCSMFDEQARLASNLGQFVAYADSLDADYQMGVITTDALSSNAGKLELCYPHPRIISHDYPEREEAFDCLFRVGVNGSPYESGLGASMRAIQLAQSADTDPVRNPNIGLVRDPANLAIVVMSDEDDQSVQPDSLLEGFFKSAKGPGGETRTRVHAIAGPVNEPCVSDQRRAQPAYRYKGMTEKTGGKFYNICLDDWQPLLQSLGIDVFVPQDQWGLSQAATPGSVTVTVDGIPVPQSGQNGYVYNTLRNVVEFYGSAVPGPGQQIVVDYLGNCTP